MRRKSRTGGVRVDPWQLEAAGEPRRDDVPRVGKADKSAARMRSYVKFATYSLPPLLGLFGLGLVAAVTDTTTGGVSQVQVSDSLPGKSVALAAVADWLASEPSPLPGGRIDAWEGAMMQEPTKPEGGDGLDQYVHTVGVSAGGWAYRVQVSVGVDGAGQMVALSAPSLEPVGRASGGQVWNGVGEGVADEAGVASAVDEWARAYWSGDSARLRQAVGDQDVSRAYLALPGAQVRASVKAVGASGVGEGYAIARVQVAVSWDVEEGEERVDAGDAEPLEYDVLVADAASAAPRVVAWGGAGTGPGLTPFQNARVDTIVEG